MTPPSIISWYKSLPSLVRSPTPERKNKKEKDWLKREKMREKIFVLLEKIQLSKNHKEKNEIMKKIKKDTK